MEIDNLMLVLASDYLQGVFNGQRNSVKERGIDSRLRFLMRKKIETEARGASRDAARKYALASAPTPSSSKFIDIYI